jgi:hypothetical protein
MRLPDSYSSGVYCRKLRSHWRTLFLTLRFLLLSSTQYWTRTSTSHGSLRSQNLKCGSKGSRCAGVCALLAIWAKSRRACGSWYVFRLAIPAPDSNKDGTDLQAATKLRAFFLALLQPIRASMTTNMHVLQTTVFLKYRPLYAFLMRHASNVATEVQKAYVATARTYYETGFRRYMRSLGWIKVGLYSDSEFHLLRYVV